MSGTSVIGNGGNHPNRDDRVESLQQKHSELDAALKAEEARPLPDSLKIATLKRKKLAIKDELAQLSSN